MREVLLALSQWLADSPLNVMAVGMLRGVPGLPPILQTLHLLAVAVIMGTTVVLGLRVAGLAVPSQEPREMLSRLLPWSAAALAVLLLAALPLLLARPHRYLLNPVFGIKMGALLTALLATGLLWRWLRRSSVGQADNRKLRGLAVVVVLAWLSVAMAGRWIAYSEYLFMPG